MYSPDAVSRCAYLSDRPELVKVLKSNGIISQIEIMLSLL